MQVTKNAALASNGRKQLYRAPRREPVLVDVPLQKYLLIDGRGDPHAPEFQQAVEALFSISYSLKFVLRRHLRIDVGVSPLEGLWWSDQPSGFPTDRSRWRWTLMIAQPDQVDRPLVRSVIADLEKKKENPALGKPRLKAFREGLAAQIMHVGAFNDEGPTVQRLHEFINEHGYRLNGKHHEIYLSDYRRVAPERMKTILRQPMRPAAARAA